MTITIDDINNDNRLRQRRTSRAARLCRSGPRIIYTSVDTADRHGILAFLTRLYFCASNGIARGRKTERESFFLVATSRNEKAYSIR